MRFALLVKASPESEAGVLPAPAEVEEIRKFNDQMIHAGIMLAADGLKPTSIATRVTFKQRKPTVVDGPFADAEELVAGYWIIQVKSKEEAIEWARRAPFIDGEIEVRPIYEIEDFGNPTRRSP
jgi:hypothetical protein